MQVAQAVDRGIGGQHSGAEVVPGKQLEAFVAQMDPTRISYIHVAGHEYDERFGMYIDTHSQPVEPATRQMARQLAQSHGLDILLEWDNDIPDMDVINQELSCLRPSTTM